MAFRLHHFCDWGGKEESSTNTSSFENRRDRSQRRGGGKAAPLYACSGKEKKKHVILVKKGCADLEMKEGRKVGFPLRREKKKGRGPSYPTFNLGAVRSEKNKRMIEDRDLISRSLLLVGKKGGKRDHHSFTPREYVSSRLKGGEERRAFHRYSHAVNGNRLLPSNCGAASQFRVVGKGGGGIFIHPPLRRRKGLCSPCRGEKGRKAVSRS